MNYPRNRASAAVGVLTMLWTITSSATELDIETLYRLDRLPVLRQPVKVASVSSYDRTGGNNDGFGGEYSYVRKEDGALVLADLQGPGVIYRIWTPTPTDDIMEFYFDGEKKPRIRVGFREMFLGGHPLFARPLVGFGAGGFYSYVPLPFAKSCTVRILAERVQFYQINYAIYQDSTPIETFTPSPTAEYQGRVEKAAACLSSAGSDITAFTSPPGSTTELSESVVTLTPGKPATIFQTERPGRIVGLRISPADALAGKARDVVLRVFWDGDDKPAVNCPAGDFFGYAWGQPAMKSLLVGTADGVNYCYYPMPFEKSARIELQVDSDRTISGIKTQVITAPVGETGEEGRFYALWRRENPTTQGKPFTFIETEGPGHLVGFIQQSQGLESGNTYFFEGDDQTTIAGELVIHGTGSEDFYNGGWYDVPGRWETRRSFPLSGCLGYKKHLGRTGGYRLLLGDAYRYGESILQTIEHAPTNNDLINDYIGVTFLYSEDRPTCDFALPALAERRVIDLDRIVFATWWNIPIHAWSFRDATLTKAGEKFGDKEVRFLSMKSQGGDWFGHHFISFVCELPAAGKYRISLDVIRGPAQGRVQLFHDEAPVGPVADMYAKQRAQAIDQYVGTLDLVEGPNNLLLKLVGKHDDAGGVGLDLTNIICRRVPE